MEYDGSHHHDHYHGNTCHGNSHDVHNPHDVQYRDDNMGRSGSNDNNGSHGCAEYEFHKDVYDSDNARMSDDGKLGGNYNMFYGEHSRDDVHRGGRSDGDEHDDALDAQDSDNNHDDNSRGDNSRHGNHSRDDSHSRDDNHNRGDNRSRDGNHNHDGNNNNHRHLLCSLYILFWCLCIHSLSPLCHV